MGWYPQKKIDFFQEQTRGLMPTTSLNLYSARKSRASFNEIHLPLDLLDRRELAIILVLGFSILILISVNYLNRTAASFFGIIIANFSFILSFNLFDQNKLSIDTEKLVIKKYFFESIKIQKKNIKSIKIIENVLNKNRWINLVLLILILLMGFVEALSLYSEIMHSAALEDALLRIANSMFLFIILTSIFIRNNRRSCYPKIMQINAANKKFTLYPRNESEFIILKEELET